MQHLESATMRLIEGGNNVDEVHPCAGRREAKMAHMRCRPETRESEATAISGKEKAHMETHVGLKCIKNCLVADGKNDQLPADSALPLRVLVMVLRRQSVPLGDTNLVTTPRASVDARVGRLRTRRMAVVELLMRVVLQKLLVLV